MSSDVCEDPIASSQSKVLKALKSRYTCIHEPLPAVVNSAIPEHNQRYLTYLRVYANREPQSPLSVSSSMQADDQHIIDPQTVKEKVTSALKGLSFREREARVLVQFWSPVAIRKRWLLTTLDQPFGVGVIDEGLYKHRLKSESRMFVVDEEHREELGRPELGSPGRVYCQKLPEWSLDIKEMSDWAATHNINGYLYLPVFEPDNGRCLGVLELVTSSNYVDFAFEVQQVSRALKEENLKSPNVFEDASFYARVGGEKRQHELDEIFQALKMVCDTHNIPIAQTWGPCGYSSFVAHDGNLERSCSSFSRNCIGKVCISTAALPFYVRDVSMRDFRETCRARHLEKSQGVVGRSLSSCGSCFCGNVSQLGEEEYPLGPYARMNGITGCLAIYLKSTEMDGEYVVELFFPTQNENEADLQSLVKTVKQQIMSASTIQLGDISSVQVIGGTLINLNLESPNLTQKVGVPLELENSHSLAENKINKCDVEQMEEDKPSNSAAEGTNQNENYVVPYLDVGTEDVDINITGKMMDKDFDYSTEPIRKKMRIIRSITFGENKRSNSAAAGMNKKQNVVVPFMDVRIEDVDVNTENIMEQYIDYAKRPIGKKKKTDRSFSLKEISKHYGNATEEDTAFRVSRSTLKRICRSHGIPRWPYTRTPNETDPLLNPDQTDALVLRTPNAPNTTHDPATLIQHNNHLSGVVLRSKEQKNPTDGHAKPQKAVKGRAH